MWFIIFLLIAGAVWYFSSETRKAKTAEKKCASPPPRHPQNHEQKYDDSDMHNETDIEEHIIKKRFFSSWFSSWKEFLIPVLIAFARCNNDIMSSAKKNFIEKSVREFLKEMEKGTVIDVYAEQKAINKIIQETLHYPYGYLEALIKTNIQKFQSTTLVELQCIKMTVSDTPEIGVSVLDELLELLANEGTPVTEKERRWLDIVARELHIDEDEYKKSFNKAFPPIIFNKNLTKNEILIELGVTPRMNDEEKRRQLSKVYREWNAKKNSSEEITRVNAQRIVELISKLRAEL